LSLLKRRGGITVENVGRVGATAARGVAVVGAVMAAPDPGAATRALLEGFDRVHGRHPVAADEYSRCGRGLASAAAQRRASPVNLSMAFRA
jgi:hypothetical protein